MQDWDDLRFFLAVARAGSLSAAARTLGVAQPTVGRRIQAFEGRLGARLFEAHANGQRATATGHRLLDHAEAMEAHVLSIERVASGRDAGLRGLVRVTASEWLVEGVLGTLIAPLVEHHPQLTIELLADVRHVSLTRREAEIAVRPSRFQEPDVVALEVASLGFGLYASDSYLAARGVPSFGDQCEGHCLIAMSESLGKIPDVDWLPRFAARARVVIRSNGRLPMLKLAEKGVGLACLPHFLGDASPVLRRLSPPVAEPVRALYLGAHRETRSVARVKATLSALRDGLRRLQPALREARG